MKRLRLCLFVAIVPLLGAAQCAHDVVATSPRTVCAPWKPITYSGTRDTAPTTKQVRVHNLTGRNLGCWK